MLAIIGTGKMAEALIEGLKNEYSIEVVGRNSTKLKELSHKYGVSTATLDRYDITDKIVILCVKPYALDEVAHKLTGQARVLISILAGTPIINLQKIAASSYIRAMPNIAALKKASMTTITGNSDAKEIATKIFRSIGRILWVETEKELDIATAIAGSGPAFLALVAEALADGGVYCGLRRDAAVELVRGLFAGYAALEEIHPAAIKESVMSPGGTTAAGIKALEEKAARAAFIDAIAAAYERTK